MTVARRKKPRTTEQRRVYMKKYQKKLRDKRRKEGYATKRIELHSSERHLWDLFQLNLAAHREKHGRT